MSHPSLVWHSRPRLNQGRLILSFTGWMDGGEASTGTVSWLAEQMGAEPFADIEPQGFYILNFPGSMEIAAMFRPSVKYVDGVIESFEMPANTFHASPLHNTALFVGREPNFNWEEYADCLFEVAREAGVGTIYFVGTFAGSTPHTRQPRLYLAVSDPALKPALAHLGLRYTDYEGPASFAAYLMSRATEQGLKMVSLVAEIPGYVQGVNPMSIESVTRKLAAMLNLQVELAPLRSASDEWETQITDAAAKDEDLAKQIRELEEQYDNELIERGEG